MASAISMTMILFAYLFTKMGLEDDESSNDVLDLQIEAYSTWSIFQQSDPINSDTNIQSKTHNINDHRPLSKQYPKQIRSSLYHDITRNGRALIKFNQDIENNNTDHYYLESEELVDSEHDYPWGHIYKSRVWCNVLTMWPERRQNIEVTSIFYIN